MSIRNCTKIKGTMMGGYFLHVFALIKNKTYGGGRRKWEMSLREKEYFKKVLPLKIT